VDASDPFSTDPERHPALIVNQQRPFNAETPPSLAMDNFRTPNDLFFVRNHMPVPKIDAKNHRLSVEGLGVKRLMNISVDHLKRNFEPVSVTAAIQCAGNRRENMNKYKKCQGLMWKENAISNAEWTGVRLRDLLLLAGVNPNDPRIKYVHLEGADADTE
ncbi:oxidoreductase molybdopterin binding domain protein, partial [Necator americanus]